MHRHHLDSLDIDRDDSDTHVHLYTNRERPSFLGKEDFLDQNDVSLLRRIGYDETSDVMKLAAKGSATLRDLKSQKDRTQQMREQFKLSTSSQPSLEVEFHEDEDDNDDDNDDVDPSSITAIELPIDAKRDEIIATVRENIVTLLVGETGSGKTTRVPSFLFGAGFASSGVICCTQPRRVAAVSIAKRVNAELPQVVDLKKVPGTSVSHATERRLALGELVGYNIRFDEKTSPSTRLLYMTDGILLREALRDPDLSRYSVVVIDEVHERSVTTDVLLGLLRRIACRRRDIRIIIMSATMDVFKMAAYLGNPPLVRVPGRTFPVTTHYAKTVVDDYLLVAVHQVLFIHYTRPAGDVLVFMTGQEDVEACALLVYHYHHTRQTNANSQAPAPTANAPTTEPNLMIVPIYGLLPAHMQNRIFAPAPPGVRKIIIATNIAETSITVPNIRYVVDAGLYKCKVYNARSGLDTLRVLPISQQQAAQRSGRAGRTSEGECYRLYTAPQFAELRPGIVPEILRSNLSAIILLLRGLGEQIDLLDPPPQSLVNRASHVLWMLGALDHAGRLTSVGKRMAELPLDPSLAKMMIVALDMQKSAANSLGGPSRGRMEDDVSGSALVEDVASIVAMLSVPSVFLRPVERAEEADAKREKFMVAQSDHLTLLNVYSQYSVLEYGSQRAFCVSNFINERAMKRVVEVREQLINMLGLGPRGESQGQSRTYRGARRGRSDWNAVRECVCAGFFYHACRLRGVGEYVNLISSNAVSPHPSSAMSGRINIVPDYVVYHELMNTSGKEYMSVVTAVEPEWLVKHGSAIFSTEPPSKRKEEDKISVPTTAKPELRVAVEQKGPAKVLGIKERFVSAGTANKRDLESLTQSSAASTANKKQNDSGSGSDSETDRPAVVRKISNKGIRFNS